MLRLSVVAAFTCLSVVIPIAQIAPTPLTQRQACEKFAAAVVRIEAGGKSRGTGFLVSPDGFVLTAAHVIIDQDSGQYFSAVLIRLPDGTSPLAEIVSLMTPDNIGQDFGAGCGNQRNSHCS
jgi:hypothetical protein